MTVWNCSHSNRHRVLFSLLGEKAILPFHPISWFTLELSTVKHTLSVSPHSVDPGHTQTPHVTEVGPLSPSPGHWDHRHLPPCPATGKLLGWLYFLWKSDLWYSLVIMSLLRFLGLRYFWRLCFLRTDGFPSSLFWGRCLCSLYSGHSTFFNPSFSGSGVFPSPRLFSSSKDWRFSLSLLTTLISASSLTISFLL